MQARPRLPAPGEWDYFEHGADIGVRGLGRTPEAAFEACAAATFAIMAPPPEAGPPAAGTQAEARVAFEESDLEVALLRWLNALLAASHEQGACFERFHLERRGRQWLGQARGGHWQPGAPHGTEVKGATFTALHVGQREGGWEARCVVDV